MKTNKNDVKNVLRDRRIELGYTMKELAAMVGVSEATISRWESGDIANMRRDRIANLAKALRISPAVIMGWDEKPHSPLYEAAAGEGRINDGYPSEELSIKLDPDQIAVLVKGRSMEPALRDGDLVIVTATSEVDYPNQIALVKVNGDEATLKRVKVLPDGLRLEGDNYDVYHPRTFTAKEVEELPVRIVGVVSKLIREM